MNRNFYSEKVVDITIRLLDIYEKSWIFVRKKLVKDLVVIEKLPTFALANRNWGTSQINKMKFISILLWRQRSGQSQLRLTLHNDTSKMIFERNSIKLFVEKYKEDKLLQQCMICPGYETNNRRFS